MLQGSPLSPGSESTARTDRKRWNLGDPVEVLTQGCRVTDCEYKGDKPKTSSIPLSEVRLVHSSDEAR